MRRIIRVTGKGHGMQKRDVVCIVLTDESLADAFLRPRPIQIQATPAHFH